MPKHELKKQRIGDAETDKLLLNSQCYSFKEAIS